MVKRILISLIVFSMFLAIIYIPTQSMGITGSNELKIGAWVGTQPTQAEVKRFQELQQRKLDIIHQFVNFSTEFSWIRPYADTAHNNGSVLMITWEPWEYNTVDISNGRADSYITRMASNMKDYGREIWIRPLHEANGDWYPWAVGYPGRINTNQTYITAFRRIVDIFRQQGAHNVKWVYTINHSNVGQGTSFLNFYPGDNYVDYTSIDGYNWGPTQDWGSVWQTFDEIFLESYNALITIDKPIILGEWASSEIGGDKARWITESFNTLRTSYPRIFASVWFSENKETDWRIDSSNASLQAYRNAVAGSVTPPTTSTPPLVKHGDLNYDDQIDSTDYILLKRYILGIAIFNTRDEENRFKTSADLNGDGQVDSTDAVLLRRYILNIIDKLPV
ncbi:UNVERIFIED_CONTAM: endoglucanase [Acetivibrio alkalicellulosi]